MQRKLSSFNFIFMCLIIKWLESTSTSFAFFCATNHCKLVELLINCCCIVTWIKPSPTSLIPFFVGDGQTKNLCRLVSLKMVSHNFFYHTQKKRIQHWIIMKKANLLGICWRPLGGWRWGTKRSRQPGVNLKTWYYYYY